MKPQRDPAARVKSPVPLKRVGWLLGSFAAGAIVAAVGSSMTGSDLWYLAIPVAVASVWLFVADPTKCEPTRDRGQPRSGQ